MTEPNQKIIVFHGDEYRRNKLTTLSKPKMNVPSSGEALNFSEWNEGKCVEMHISSNPYFNGSYKNTNEHDNASSERSEGERSISDFETASAPLFSGESLPINEVDIEDKNKGTHYPNLRDSPERSEGEDILSGERPKEFAGKCYFYSLYSIIAEHSLGQQWTEPEWGFPKGRRNYQEKDFDTAIREFKEETGYDPKLLKNIQNIYPFEENLVGSNYKCYKHKYYLMYMDYNDSIRDKDFSNSEISCAKWKTYQECLHSIRDYNVEKKRIIINIHQCLNKYGLYC